MERELLSETVVFTAYDVYCYGLERTLTPDMSFVVDQFALQRIEILSDEPRKRTAILERLRG